MSFINWPQSTFSNISPGQKIRSKMVEESQEQMQAFIQQLNKD